jgi:hypothetical protein
MATLAELALLGGPLARWLDHLQPPYQQVVDCSRAGRSSEAEAPVKLGEDRRALRGSQVEVTPEQQRRVSRPLVSRGRGSQHILCGQLWIVSGGVQVGDAESGRGTSEGHRASLGAALMDRQLAALDDPLFAPVRLWYLMGG